MAQLVVAAAGAALGAATLGTSPIFLGLTGTSIGWTLGSIAGSFLGPTQRSRGPKLDDLRVSSGEYGQAIPWLTGHPRVAGQVWWASERREIATTTEVGKGGGGAEYTSYTYEVDLLIGLCDVPIKGISRVWSNGKLVYTKLAASTVESALSSKAQADWDLMTVYTGADDQLPDPIYEAAVGIGNAPAYRGRGTVMIQGLQLGNSGQIPNLTFEVYLQGDEDGYSVRTLLDHFEGVSGGLHYGAVHFELPSFDVYFVVGGLAKVYRYTLGQPDPEVVAIFEPAESGSTSASFQTDVSGQWAMNTGSTDAYWYTSTGGAMFELPYNINASSIGVVGARRGSNVVIGSNVQSVSNQKRLYRYSTSGGTLGATSDVMAHAVRHVTIAGDRVYAADAPGATLASTEVYEFDLATMAYLGAIPMPAGYGNHQQGELLTDRDEQVYLRGSGKAYRLEDGAFVLVREFAGTFTSSQGRVRIGIYDGALFSISYFNPDTRLNVVFDSVDLTEPTVRTVVESLCARAGMPAGTYDATALSSITRPVRGLAVAQVTSVRSVLEQLAAAYFFECHCADKLYFVPRGGAPALAVDVDDLGAGLDQAQPEPLPVTVTGEDEIPAQLALTYINADADYGAASEMSDRLLSGVVSTSAVQLPLAMTSAEAKGVADAMLQDAWAGRISGQAVLPQAYTRLVPTDVVTLTAPDGTAYRARLVRRTDDGATLAWEWVLDDAQALVSAGITSDDYAPSLTVSLPGPTTLVIMDAPLLRDADDTPGVYGAAKPVGDGAWPGAMVYRSLDGVEYTEVATASARAIIGETTTALSSYTGGNVFDTAGSVTVNVGAAALESATRDALLNSSANAMLVGSEVIQFTTATYVSAGVYTLTGLLRGRRGTEWAMTGHAIGETVVLLRTAGLMTIPHDAARVGLAQTYKAVTLNKTLSTAQAVSATDTGVRLKPWAPADLRRSVSSNAITLTWKRRTRLATRFLSATGAPLGESAEAYQVDVVLTSSGATLRTLTAGAEKSITYTAAQQSSDGVTAATGIRFEVYQIGALGRGYPGQLTTVGAVTPLAQITELTVGGTFEAGAVLYATLGGTIYTHTSVLGDTDIAGIATAFAAVIDAASAYSASAAGGVVTVTGALSAAYPVQAGIVPGDNSVVWSLTQTASPAVAGVSNEITLLWRNTSDPAGADAYPIGTSFTALVQRISPALNLFYTADTSGSSRSDFTVLPYVVADVSGAFGASGDGAAYGISLLVDPLDASALRLYTPASDPFNWTIQGYCSDSRITTQSANRGVGVQPATLRPQIVTLTLSGTPTVGWLYRATLAGDAFDFVATGAETTMALLATQLAAVIDAAGDYIASAVGNVITITHASDNVPFTYAASIVPSTVTLTATITQEAA